MQSHLFIKKGKFIFVFFIILLFIFTFTVFFISYKVGHSLLVKERNLNYQISLDKKEFPFEEVSFHSKKDKTLLKGVYFPSFKNKSNKTLILVHGYGHNWSINGYTEKLVKHFVPLGYNILSFDMRAHGNSQGDFISLGFHEKYDVVGAINFIESLGTPGENIALIGFSMGATTALQTIGEDERIKAVIADSPFRDLKLYLEDNLSFWTELPSFPFNFTVLWTMTFAYGLDLDKVSPMNILKNIPSKPIFLIHGKDDEAIPYSNSEVILKNIKHNPNAMAWFPESSEHIDTINQKEKEYLEKITSFLEKSLP